MKLINELINITEKVNKFEQEIKKIIELLKEEAYKGNWGVSIPKKEQHLTEVLIEIFEKQGLDVEETASHIKFRWDKSLVINNRASFQ